MIHSSIYSAKRHSLYSITKSISKGGRQAHKGRCEKHEVVEAGRLQLPWEGKYLNFY